MKRILQVISLVALSSSTFAQTSVIGEYIASKGKPTPTFAYLFTEGNSKGMQSKIANGKFGFDVPPQKKGDLTHGFIYFSSKFPFGMPEIVKEKRHKFVVEEGLVNVTYNSAKSYFVAKGGVLNQQQDMLNTIDSILFSQYETMNSSAKMHAINFKAYLATVTLIKKHPMSPVFRPWFFACIMFYPAEDSSYNELSAIYKNLPEDYKASSTGKAALRELEKLKEKIEIKRSIEGMDISDITLTNQNMVTANLFPNSNKVLLLDFWTTYCGPCKMDNPILLGLQKRYHDKGFTIVRIARDKQASVWCHYLKGKQHNYPQYWSDPVKTASHPFLGKAHGYPTYVLVDAQSMKVIKFNLGIDQVEKELKLLLK